MLQEAREYYDDYMRKSNNLLRKYCFRRCAALLHFRERRRLPLCVERCIRQAYPDKDGRYMGYYDN